MANRSYIKNVKPIGFVSPEPTSTSVLVGADGMACPH